MELNLSRLRFLGILIGLLIAGYITAIFTPASNIGNLNYQPVRGELSIPVMAAGYAGLGEGWGLKLTRSLLESYSRTGWCAFELPVLWSSSAAKAAPIPTPAAVSVNSGGRAVLIYCTHSTESYVPDGGVERTEGRPGLILEVAHTLGSELEQQGYAVTVSEELHDWPNFTSSYSHSRRTVEDFLQLHPDPAAIIDVHRDAFPDGGAITTKADGEEAAPVLLIVGTNKRQNHPHWQRNLDFANQIYATAQDAYPGLVRGVRPKAGVYNQDLSPRSILIEFGTDGNTLKQAQTSARSMGKTLGQIIGSDE